MNSYDIETYLDENGIHVPYCVCYIVNSNRKNFYFEDDNNCVVRKSILSLVECTNLKKKNLIYVHNLDFDGVFIIDSLTKNNIKFTSFIREMRIYSISFFSKNNDLIEFRCSYKLMPSSLKEISKSFNLSPKLPFPYLFSSFKNLNYLGVGPDYTYFSTYEDFEIFKHKIFFDFKGYSIEYCFRDCEITVSFVNVIQSLLKSLGFSLHNSLSAPSLSFKIFSKKFNEDKIKIRHNFITNTYAFRAYKGGNTNVYGNPRKGEKIFYYDFPGMYGKVMREKFPFGKWNFVIDGFDLKKPGLYCVTTNNSLNIPVLSHHRLIDKKLMFTTGEVTTVDWFEEILLHIEMGGSIIKIHWGLTFEKYDYVFNGYLDFFQKWREMGGEYKTFSKLMVNSLYGRMGMQPDESKNIFVYEEEMPYYLENFEVKHARQVNNMFLLELTNYSKYSHLDKKNIDSTNIGRHTSNVVIAAAITSKARIKLYRGFVSVIKNGGRILYSDTDSIFASFTKDVLGETHGEIFWDPKNKETRLKDAIFISPKVYGVVREDGTEIIKIKGYNQKKINFKELKKKFYNNQNIIIEDFTYFSLKNFNYKQTSITKTFNLNSLDKRKFSKDKLTTTPYKFNNWVYE